ncbi:MAG: hypothetical protein KAH07_06765 [Flavobacteriaceae bacterium]|nr:hypothetical protein [Flavobacteriaceae bacterium]
MKNRYLIIVLFLISVNSIYAQKELVVKNLTGYYIKNTVQFDDDFDFIHLVVTNQDDFDSYFGIAKTMKNDIAKIDFTQNNVIAILLKPSTNSKETEIVYAELDQNKLLVQYGIKSKGKTTFLSSSLYITTIPKHITIITFKSKDNISVLEVK